MTTWSADLLEFEALKELLARYIASPLGRLELARMEPHAESLAPIRETLAETAEAIDYLRESSTPKRSVQGAAVRIRFSSLPDPTAAARKLQIEGAVLDPLEILQLTQIIDQATQARSTLTGVKDRFPRLGRRAAQLADFRHALRDVSGKVLPDGAIADDASPFLSRVRREIDKQKQKIQDSLERFLRVHRDERVLQEDFVTIRNERFVVPVIAGQQTKVEGVVHGSSGSGHTLFIEPLETIELNNHLVNLIEQELAEVHRILRELTRILREYAEPIRQTVETLGALDFIFGKADFAIDFDCVIPRFSELDSRRLQLRDARHPLLQDVLRRQRKPVVPLSLELDGGCRILLISGPNTGGKTVTLKTVGLLALMAQAGLPVPCAEAEFPLFDQVLADIGDNQSIQESLSTFSAHILRLREMIDAVSPDSLVLLDELGRATDPEEGGALGIALMEHFRIRGAFALASTHLLALKVYGANTPGVLNGSMGFNEESLDPTYVLRLGAPGKSAGLDIAQRLGMPQHIMERARGAMGSREHDLARFLAELHQRLDEADALRQQAEEQKRSLEARERELAREWAQRESGRVKELDRSWTEMIRKFDAEAQVTLTAITEGADQRKAAEQASRRVAKLKREMREEFETLVQPAPLAPESPAKPPSPAIRLEEGARVRLKDLREPARVRKLLPNGILEVEAGFLKLKVPREDVLEVLPAAADTPKRTGSGIRVQQVARDSRALREINIIGQHAEEARDQVERFLDDAALAGVTQVRIVHGHGMGVLKRTVSELLAKSPVVERFYPAPSHEGGAGATIAELSPWNAE